MLVLSEKCDTNVLMELGFEPRYSELTGEVTKYVYIGDILDNSSTFDVHKGVVMELIKYFNDTFTVSETELDNNDFQELLYKMIKADYIVVE